MKFKNPTFQSFLFLLIRLSIGTLPMDSTMKFDNPNPVIYATEEHDVDDRIGGDLSVGAVFSAIRDIRDPEFPYTLEQVSHFRVARSITHLPSFSSTWSEEI